MCIILSRVCVILLCNKRKIHWARERNKKGKKREMKGERCGIVSYWGPKSRRNVGSSVREAITGTNIEHQ